MQKLKSANKNIILSAALVLIGIALIMFEAENDGGPRTFGADSLESRLEEFISDIDGTGKVKVMLSYEDGAVSGVAVLCDGADSTVIKTRIINTVSAVCAVPSNRIYVTTLKGEIAEYAK